VASAYPKSKSQAEPNSSSPTTESLHEELERLIEAARQDPSLSAMVLTELALLCTLHAFEQGCRLFERCFGFPVSTHLAYRVVMGIGKKLVDREMERAETLWKARSERPEDFEPTPAELRKRKRAKRIYVMMDNCKARIQEGQRGRGAKKRTQQKGVQERFNIAVHGPSLVKEAGEDKASRGESDWRDVRALLIYQDKDVAQCSSGLTSVGCGETCSSGSRT